jgi:hypothetical protein
MLYWFDDMSNANMKFCEWEETTGGEATIWVNVANEWAWEDGWGQTLKELESSDEGIQIRFHWIFLQSSFVTF